MNKQIIVATIATLALSACAQNASLPTSNANAYTSNQPNSQPSNSFIAANYKATDTLTAQLKGKINPAQPLIVATIVNIDDLNSSSTFGRLASEQVSARFTQTGYSMIEMKFRDFVYMKQDQGELLLTREIKDVAKTHNAQAVIVGTYALSGDTVFVNLKVIQPSTNIVLAVHDYDFDMNANLKLITKSQNQRR